MRKIAKYELPPGSSTYKLSAPLQATVLRNDPLHLPDSTDDLKHTVLDVRGADLHYVEGQSLGVLAPGNRDDGKPHKLRLYSIASARRGDDGRGETVTLCTKRVREPHWDNPDVTFRGVCSNYICDLKPGDVVQVTGPVGKHFALPLDENMHLVLMAAGTGVAPFRSFLKHIYDEHAGWKGQIRLFYGVKTQKELMYMNTVNDDMCKFDGQSNYKAYVARSRQDQRPDGGKVYVQHRLAEHAADVWELMKDGNFAMYICGLKGMEAGIEEVMEALCREHGRDWAEWKNELKLSGKWNVEVY